MRGTGAEPQPRKPQVGITPACAGNRFSDNLVHIAVRDHPRVCGEQDISAKVKDWTAGSPPRVRGTGLGGAKMQRSQRITPACAGNSGSRIELPDTGWDHPRVCGEQAL